MICADNRQEAPLLSKPNHLGNFLTIDLADDTGQKLGMTIASQQLNTSKNVIKLISTSDMFIFDRVKRIETNRKSDRKGVEYLHKACGQSGAVCNERNVKSNLNQILKD
jgi:hypothetical protein